MVSGRACSVLDVRGDPDDKDYRALWRHDFVDESEFGAVHDCASSKSAAEADIAMDNILVNYPVVIWSES